MKILALEFSSARRGVAVSEGDHVLGLAEGDGLTPGPFELIESALRAAGVEREEIECIAVGLGPGSYTGVRSAIALAQGWQLALGVKLRGVSSADVLAATAHTAGIRGLTAVVIDALRGEYYVLSTAIGDNGWFPIDELKLLNHRAAQLPVLSNVTFLSPDPKLPFANVTHLAPSARELARLASQRTDFQPGEKLEPIYLRETTFVKAPPPRFY